MAWMPLPGLARLGLFVVTTLLATLAVTALPAPASAVTLGDTLDSCPSRALQQPFKPWLDGASYFLAPGGTMEGSLANWTLKGGAKVVAGSEPYAVSGDKGRYALSLPAGSSATTPAICVGVLYPTLRYFAANDGGLLSTLRVDVLYGAPGGSVITLPLGLNEGGKSWAPSLPNVVGANLLAAGSGGQANVAFRFSPAGLGASWRIDDVYVDPYARH
jgi:hypothetical protein